jgi:acyl-coenzyme A thioesterase PaaI-like protein
MAVHRNRGDVSVAEPASTEGLPAWPSQSRQPGAPAEQSAVNDFVLAQRRALDAAVRARPGTDVWIQARQHAEAIEALLAPSAVAEGERIYGQLRNFPGRAQNLVPAVEVVARNLDEVRAEVVLDELYLGANGAAHGGVMALIFDELLGQQANTQRSKARTAYLHVNYRAITPIGVRLHLRGWFVNEQGRKRVLAGSAHAGEQLVTDAEGLFVQLLPGQP